MAELFIIIAMIAFAVFVYKAIINPPQPQKMFTLRTKIHPAGSKNPGNQVALYPPGAGSKNNKYPEGESVSIAALPVEGWQLQQFSIDNPEHIIMNKNILVEIFFQKKKG